MPEKHPETAENSTTAPTRQALGVRAKVAIAIGAVLALTLAVAIPVTAANIRADEIRADAAADAATYLEASLEAAEKNQELGDYALDSHAFVEALLIPVREAVISNPGDFSEDAAARLNESVEAVQYAIAQHSDVVVETDGDIDGDADSDSDDSGEPTVGEQTDAMPSPRPEAQTPVALEGDLAQLTRALQTAYLEANDEQRASLRLYVKEAAAQLRAEAADDSLRLLAISNANAAADDAVIAAAAAAVTAGTATLDAHPSASEEALNALRSAVATSEALAGVDTANGGLRGGEQPTADDDAPDAELASMVESLPTAFSAYVSAAGDVRASHQAAVAPPAPKNDGWCTWTVFMSGFPVWMWGPCSDRP